MPIAIGAKPDHDFSEPLGMLSDCHRRIERFLAVMQEVSDRSEDGRLTDESREPFERALEYFRTGAPRHTADEEESLFPRLRRLNAPESGSLLVQIERLESEHTRAQALHAAVEEIGARWLADSVLVPQERAMLAHTLEELGRLYAAHIALEDEQVFPLAGRILPGDEKRQIGIEMAARRSSSLSPS